MKKKFLKKDFEIKKIIQNGLINNLDLPSAVVLNKPIITVVGNSKINIENFKNILEYSNSIIKITTSCGVFKIEGKNLFLKEISKEKIFVNGNIFKFEFIL